MQRKMIIIGGGENGRPLGNGQFAPYETKFIDREIIKLTGKVNPNFLFLGHAMNFSEEIEESYYQTMKKIYGDKFNCKCETLKAKELNDKEMVKAKIEWADIIYEGGGDTNSMIKLWKATGFDKELYNAWIEGKVISGISAGAVCWFKSCNSDSESAEGESQFKNIDCLNWINAHLTPHCDENGRYESTKEQIKDNGLVGIMLSNCAALEIIDNKYRMIAGNPKNSNKVYGIKCYWNNDEYIEEILTPTTDYKNIEQLISLD